MHQAVRQVIAQARRRLGWRCWVHELGLLLSVNLSALVLAGIAGWLVGCSFPLPVWAAVAAAVAILVATVRTWGRTSDRAAALEIDRRFGLDERVVSALESSSRQSTAAERALAQDATQAVAGFDIGNRFPLFSGTAWWWPAAPAALVLALALFLPAPHTAALPPAAGVVATPEVGFAEHLQAELAERERAAKAAGLEKAAQLLAQTQREAGKLVELPQETQAALVQLNGLAEPLEERRNELADIDRALEQLSKLRDKSEGLVAKLKNALGERDAQAAADELRRLTRQMAKDQSPADVRQELARQLEQLSREIGDLAEHQRQSDHDLDDEARQQSSETIEGDDGDQSSQGSELVAGRLERLAVEFAELGKAVGNHKGAAEADDGEKLAAALDELNQEHLEGVMLGGALDEIAAAKQSLVCGGCRGAGCPTCRLGAPTTSGRTGPPGSQTGFRKAHEPHPSLPPRYETQLRAKLGEGSAQVRAAPGGPNARGQVKEAIASEWTIAEGNEADASASATLDAKYREHAQQYFDAMRGAGR